MNQSPHMNCKDAANYLCCAEYTLRLSRSTGILFTKKAPKFRKLGRKVVYDHQILQEWMEQFEHVANTVCALQTKKS